MEKIRLRNYQEEIVKDIRQTLLKGNKRVMVQAPCGSGKTETMLSLIQGMLKKGNHPVWILSHRNMIKKEIDNRMDKYDMNLPEIHNTGIRSVHKIQSKEPFAIFIDEAHHTRAKSYEDLLKEHQEAYIFGFTATPERSDGKGFKTIFEDIIEGPSVKELLDISILAPYKAYKYKAKEKTADIMGNAAEWYLKHGNEEQALYYAHRNVEDLPMIKEMFEREGIKAEYIVGGNKEKQEQIMERFRNKDFQVLISIDTLGEGIDVPECSIVIMGRKTTSSTVYIQQVMRCMRIDPKNPKKVAKIVDLVGNFDVHGTVEQERNWTLLYDKQSLTTQGKGKRRQLVRNKVTFNFKTEIEEINPADYNITKDTELMTYHEVIARFKAMNYLPGWVYHQMKHKAWQDRNPDALPYSVVVKALYEDYNRRNGTNLKPGTRNNVKRTVFNY